MKPADRSLPGLSVALDTAHGACVAADALGLASGWELAGWELERFRWRPGRRAFVQYRCAVTRGLQRSITWIGVALHGETRRRSERSARTGPFLRRQVSIESLRWTVTAFPHDRRLPALAALLRSAPSTASVVTRYRMGLAATIRLVGDGGDRFVKVHNPGEGDRAVERARAFTETASDAVLSPPVASYRSFSDVTVTHKARGRVLEVRDDPSRIAAGLAGLHSRPGPPVPASSSSARAERARRVLMQVMDHSALRPRPTTAPSPHKLVHGDLKPEHMLVAGDRMVLIDLDSSGAGDPLGDIATLAVRMPRAWAESFVDEYRCASRPVGWERWPLRWREAQLAQALSRFVRLRPDWEEEVCSILDRALEPI